jgi:hypothetical protein
MSRFRTAASVVAGALLFGLLHAPAARAQLNDISQTPNTENEGIKKTLLRQIGASRGNATTPDSSIFLIQRDPARSVQRGRQIFQRKFCLSDGLGPRMNDGVGDIMKDAAHGAGLSDSCAACHSRPRGSAGVGGNVFTRPDSRDAPHLFGLGIVEMLADEMTQELRAIRTLAVNQAVASGQVKTKNLVAKGVHFGQIRANPAGFVDTSLVAGVNEDLRVRPFFHEGSVFSMREFAVGAFNAEMGLQAYDPDLNAAASGAVVTTPSGLVLDGTQDKVNPSPAFSAGADPDGDGIANELDVALIDHMEFYLLNYFKPATYRQTVSSQLGRFLFNQIGCAVCHVPSLTIDADRRVADVETQYDPQQGGFNRLFSTATTMFSSVADGSGYPDLLVPNRAAFTVHNFFSDLKRHDLGPGFWERNFDGTMQKLFVTEPLWGVATTAPYGHDGRSINLREVILRHGGEAQAARSSFAAMGEAGERAVLAFLETLVLFGPPDTASNLAPAVPTTIDYPQRGHGSIDLSALFLNPTDKE